MGTSASRTSYELYIDSLGPLATTRVCYPIKTVNTALCCYGYSIYRDFDLKIKTLRSIYKYLTKLTFP
jgi:hypothetical protein